MIDELVLNDQFRKYLDIVENTDETFVLNSEDNLVYTKGPNSVFVSVKHVNMGTGLENLVGFSMPIGDIIETLLKYNYPIALNKFFCALNLPENLTIKEKIAYYQLLGYTNV